MSICFFTNVTRFWPPAQKKKTTHKTIKKKKKKWEENVKKMKVTFLKLGVQGCIDDTQDNRRRFYNRDKSFWSSLTRFWRWLLLVETMARYHSGLWPTFLPKQDIIICQIPENSDISSTDIQIIFLHSRKKLICKCWAIVQGLFQPCR